MPDRRKTRLVAAGVGGILALVAIGAWLIPDMIAAQRAVRTYTSLLSASFAGDLDRVRSLCSDRYLRTHVLETAREGGVVGLPRGINKNFQVWRDGDQVLLCPTNRIGPLYRFVKENGDWKFDGVAGLLRSGGRIERLPEDGTGMTEAEAVSL